MSESSVYERKTVKAVVTLSPALPFKYENRRQIVPRLDRGAVHKSPLTKCANNLKKQPAQFVAALQSERYYTTNTMFGDNVNEKGGGKCKNIVMHRIMHIAWMNV